MTRPLRLTLQLAAGAVALVLAAGFGAPYVNADQYGKRLQGSLERALGRRVQLGRVRFTLFQGPGLSVDGVTIFEDPALGIEPVAYVQEDSGTLEVVPSLWALMRGRFQISSIRLEGASINLAKSEEAGRWNFESWINPTVMRTTPAMHVRNSRINFKFGDTKSVFYLTETDLDITPPGRRGGGWNVYCSAKPARTDRSAQGLGSFSLRGRWWVSPERVDLDLDIDRTGVGDLTALWRGQAGGLHGTISSRLHLAGPIDGIGIMGRLNIEDVHRWDLLPPHGQGWPIDVRGRLDLLSQQLELQSWSAGDTTLPLSVRFRASQYLSRPHWAVAVNWNRFPVEPLMGLATHMGAAFPRGLKLSGTIDGAIGYSGEGSFQGQLAFHDAALTIPDSPPVRFDQAYVVIDPAHVRLSPALARTEEQDQARVEADYDMTAGSLDLTISTEAMKVASLRAQVSLAAVPWLEQVTDGQWKGNLHYHRDPEAAGWTGSIQLSDARIPVAGLADPLQLSSVRAQIIGARLVLDSIQAAAGKLAFTGEYRYEPDAPRPHRLRLRAAELDAAELEAELLPTLRRSSGLIARALGRNRLPDWLSERGADGTVQIDDLRVGGSHLQNVRARLVWDSARAELDNLQAKLDQAAITGRLAINLRGARPAYKFTGRVKGLSWQSGKMDAQGTFETAGTGSEVLANLQSEATFTASALDFGTVPPWRAVSGSCSLAWSPRLRVSGVNLKTEDETYTGHGSVQDDGRLLITLSNGTKEMRMTGTLAKLKVEEAAR